MGGIQEIQKLYTLKKFSILRSFVLPLLLCVWLGGCATYPKIKVDAGVVNLKSVRTELPESELLDVRIRVFDPGELPTSKDASRGLSKEIRKAESYYMAVQLRNAMQQTGHWGAVRVVPEGSSGDEVLVIGRILKSNGEELELAIEARDAMGTQWFKKTFEGAVSVVMYRRSSKKHLEVFQNIYHRIANELAAYRQTMMTSKQVHKIRQVAEMRFAEELAPDAFTGYLKKDEKKGRIGIDRLPSEDDEMLARVRRIRERDYMLVDTLDAHYEGLHRDMEEVYTGWRKSRLVEMNMIRDVDAKKNKERWKGAGLVMLGAALGALAGSNNGYNPGVSAAVGAVAGAGVAVMLTAGQITEEAEINKAALEELGVSFGADVAPIVVEVEGETVELTGSAEAKYQQWRKVLGRLYQVETEAEMAPIGP